MEQDQVKVDAIIAQLKKDTGGEWSEATGFFVVYAVTYNGDAADVDFKNGMIQKAFIQTTTGEVRYYWIDKIKKKKIV